MWRKMKINKRRDEKAKVKRNSIFIELLEWRLDRGM